MVHVLINCAMSADGKIASNRRKQTTISSEEDLQRVHLLRNSCDAILVGVGTVLADDPKLTVKREYVPDPRQPLRVVLDSRGRTPRDAQVLNDAGPTLIATTESCGQTFDTAEVVRFGDDRVDLTQLLKFLEEKRGVSRLLVEGGESVIWSFLSQRLADELLIYVGSLIIGGIGAPTLAGGEGFSAPQEFLSLQLKDVERMGDGVLLHYFVMK